ncbi:MAG: CpaF family protein [Acidimicrobiia bacterium]
MTERLVRRVVESELPFDAGVLRRAVSELRRQEAPLAGEQVVDDVVASLVGLGPLEPLLADPTVSDIFVNGRGEVWVERSGTLHRADVEFPDADAVVAIVERMIAPLGLRLDRASPAVDARLPDGSRLHAIVPPVSVDGPVIAIRRFTQAVPDLETMMSCGAIDRAGVEMLTAAVRSGRSLLIAGPTGAGKTTLLNLLGALIPAGERIVTVEDAAELQIGGHVVRLEARPANTEGAGEVTLQALVRHALRLRPDRMIVGEVRGPEALDMVLAMATGHRGSMSTVHAARPDEALLRVEALATSSETAPDQDTLRRLLRGAVDLVVQMERRRGQRRVAVIAEVGEEGPVEVHRC